MRAMRRLNLHFVLCFIVFSIPLIAILLGEKVLNFSLPEISLFSKMQALSLMMNDPYTIVPDTSKCEHEHEVCCNIQNVVEEDHKTAGRVLPPVHDENKHSEENHMMPLAIGICFSCKVIGHAQETKKKDLHKKGEVVYNMRN